MSSANKGILVVNVGPSGVGKSTISRAIKGPLALHYIVSATTRPKGPNEDQGKTYEHISRAEFLSRLERDEFLEYALVFDEYYGTPRHPTLDLIAKGENVLLELDIQGALQVKSQYPEALLMFILPPSIDALRDRLEKRGRDSAEKIARRVREAKREIHMARGSRAFDVMVVNDQLDEATKLIEQTVRNRLIEKSL